MLKCVLRDLFTDAVETELGQGHRDGIAIPKSNGIEEFVKEHGRGVLKVSEEEMVSVEQAFWGLEMETAEEKIDVVEGIFAGLGLGEKMEKG